jgi:DNA-binding transcriptional regulator YiaG
MTGDDLKKARGGLGLSQEALAREFEVAVSTVARWEQLGAQEIPNSGMLRLALEALEARRGGSKKGGRK